MGLDFTRCKVCHKLQFDDKPNPCYYCRNLRDNPEEAEHPRCIRCPYCRYIEEVVPDGDRCYLYEDEEHDVECTECGKEYQITTHVSYSFESRAIEGDTE